MLGFSLGEIVTLLFAIAICLGLVIAWIVRSEARRAISRDEIRKLRTRLGKAERERIMLLEDMEQLKEYAIAAETSEGAASDEGSRKAAPNKMVLKKMVEKNDSLEKEIAALKTELEQAKSSLEEVYKALVEQ